jgi:muconolactone D-isomerase
VHAVDDDQQNVALRRQTMEFLVEFEVDIPDGALESEVADRTKAEAAAAAALGAEGHLLRLWTVSVEPDESKALGVYRAASRAELDRLLAALPLYDWLRITVTPLAPHPNDPAAEPLPA